MITALDHIVIICPTIDAGEASMNAVLGRTPDWRAHDPGGSASLIYRVENTAIELLAPAGGGRVFNSAVTVAPGSACNPSIL